MLREMKISLLAVEPQTNTPIVVLKDPKRDTLLPICIGMLEATAIASELEQVRFSRPMTHDLIKRLLDSLGATVDWVEVCDLRDKTFYAWIHLRVRGKKVRIDARPSDALAIALRMNAQIFVDEKVLAKSKSEETGAKAAIQRDEAKQWTEILNNLAPEDFGKYEI